MSKQLHPAYWTRLTNGAYATATAPDGPFIACPVSDAAESLKGALVAHEFYHGPVSTFVHVPSPI